MLLLASSICPLMDEAKGLVYASWSEGLALEKTGSYSSGQGLAQLSFNPIICWWVGLYSFLSSCLAWSDPALGSTGCMVGLMVASKRANTKGVLSGLLLPVPLCCAMPLLTDASTGDPPTQLGFFWFSLLWGHCSFPLGFGVSKILFMSSKTRVSVYSSPVEIL